MNRVLEIYDGGEESAALGFARDARAMALVAAEPERGRALWRLWRRPRPALSLGRYHRMGEGGPGLERRLSGGTIVPLGPRVLGGTMVLPGFGWLSAATGGTAVTPARVLNRALRPLLGVLRALGVHAYYPGRDLVTVASRPLLHASFTEMPDRLLVVESHLALEPTFGGLAPLLESFDPEGVAASDPARLASAASLSELGSSGPRDGWTAALAQAASRVFGACEVLRRSVGGELDADQSAAAPAFAAFLGERRQAPPRSRRAVRPSMLGLVEASARVEDGRLFEAELCGDLIAPFAALEAISEALEGAVLEARSVARAVARASADPRLFVLGCADLAELVTAVA